MKLLQNRNAIHRLYSVAARLGVSKSSLAEIIVSHGFTVGHSYDQILSVAEVNLVAKLYVDAVRRQFKALLVRRHEKGSLVEESLQHFAFFTTQSAAMRGELDPADWELDDQLIVDRFYEVISRTRSYETIVHGVIKSILKRLVKVVRTCAILARTGILSIIPPMLFFKYVDEEDSNSVASSKLGFAVAGT